MQVATIEKLGASNGCSARPQRKPAKATAATGPMTLIGMPSMGVVSGPARR